MRTHKDLKVWIKAIDLVKLIYEITESYPASEKFGIVSQMRRSVVSIPSNIAEGSGRNSDKELIRSLYIDIALGSSSELETLTIVSEKLKFINNEYAAEICNLLNEIIRMTVALIKSIKNKNVSEITNNSLQMTEKSKIENAKSKLETRDSKLVTRNL